MEQLFLNKEIEPDMIQTLSLSGKWRARQSLKKHNINECSRFNRGFCKQHNIDF